MRTLRYPPALHAAALALAAVVAVAGCGSRGPVGEIEPSAPGAAAVSGTPTSPAASIWSIGDAGSPEASGASASESTDTAAASYPPTAAPTATAGPTRGPTVTPRPPTPAPTPAPPAGGPCYVFPSSNVWNRTVALLPVASNSAAMVSAIGSTAYLHPDFDAIGDGIPYNIVTTSTPTYTVAFDYADESDPGPYPIPSGARIEAGSDRHLLSLDLGQCKLWELYDVRRSGSSWSAGSGAVFDLRSNALRPAGWTSADAAGLPIFPGLVRYDEVSTGSINHAIRFTAPSTCGYIYPARHLTAPACSTLPPMGLRLRLKASVDISGFGPHAQIVLTALKRYGMILADNGSPWYISGVPDKRWNDDEMHQLQTLTGADFEVVDTSALRNG